MPFSHLGNGDGVLYCTMYYGVVVCFHPTIDTSRTFEVYECGVNDLVLFHSHNIQPTKIYELEITMILIYILQESTKTVLTISLS